MGRGSQHSDLALGWPGRERDGTLPGVSDDALRRLGDDREIRDVVLRYCRGIDRMDRALVHDCYHPDAIDEHGSFRGGVDEYLDWVWPLLAKYTNTMHFVGNQLVEIAGDVAAVETYGIAFHRSEDARPELNLITGFRFLDRFERREARWRIAHRRAVTEWSRIDDEAGRFLPGSGLLQGERDSSDASYALFRALTTPPLERD